MTSVYKRLTAVIDLASLERHLNITPGALDYITLARDLIDFYPNPINTGLTPNSDAYLKVRAMLLGDLALSASGRIVTYRLCELDNTLILKLKFKD